MSCWADLRSVPSLKRTMASETPWLDDDCTVSAPVTPWSALTTGWVTWVSTMSGEAPGYGVITMTAAIRIFGEKAFRSLPALESPGRDTHPTPLTTYGPRWRGR